MSERKGEAGGESKAKPSLGEFIRKLMGSQGDDGSGQGAQQQGNIITGLDIVRIIEMILEDTAARMAEKEKSDFEPVFRSEEVLETVRDAARRLIDIYVKDGISRIVPPVAARPVVVTRVNEAIVLLQKMVAEEWKRARAMMEAGAPAHEVRRQLYRAILASQLSYLVAETLMEKLVTLALINAPAPLRPPLVNVALGFDILSPQGLRRRRRSLF